MSDYGLVLSSDGSKTFFELGMVRAFKEIGVEYTTVVGTMYGMINACLFALQNNDEALGFWSEAIKDNVFGIISIVGKKYENEWCNLEHKAFKKEYFKFIQKSDTISPLKNILEKYIDEKAVRRADIQVGINTINSNLEYETLMVDEIPRGKLMQNILLGLLFPQLALLNSPNINHGQSMLNFLYEFGYDDMIISEESIESVPNDKNAVYVKSSEFLGLEEFSLSSMNKNIKNGYLDTLCCFDMVKGKYYYIIDDTLNPQYSEFKESVGKAFNNSLDDLLKKLLQADTINKFTVETVVRKYLNHTSFKGEDNIYLSMIENLAKILNIENKEKYTYTSLINKIHSSVNKNINKNLEIIREESYLKKMISHTPNGIRINKNIFMQYFLILVSANPKSYDKLGKLFNELPKDIVLAVIALIYILY